MTMPLCKKASSIKTWFAKIVVGKLKCPAQSPAPDPYQLLWNELEPSSVQKTFLTNISAMKRGKVRMRCPLITCVHKPLA